MATSTRRNFRDEHEAPFFAMPAPKVYLYLLLTGLSVAFAVLAVAYVYTRAQYSNEGLYLPPIFIFNSLILIISSWSIGRARHAYEADDTAGYQRSLWLTLLTTFLFLVAQIFAWTVAKEQLLGENIGNGKNYLYILSGLHFLHVVGGIPFLLLFINTARVRMQEPVSVLIYFADPTKRLKLELLTTYWRFLDRLWLVLVAFFLLNMLIG